MREPAKKPATYEDLYDVPENLIGEIVNGELTVPPRPTRKHGYAATALIEEVGPPYHRGRGGPGGWSFIAEPEVIFGEDIMAPDVAGWKAQRFLWEEDRNPVSVAPDWVCEVLSPKTVRNDKVRKMPVYARHGVGHIWLIDPAAMTMDAFRLESGRWLLLASFSENDKARVEPFQEIEINLAYLWAESSQPPTP
ncbi:MAG: Uma2 family endonuclease [Syntrophobacteraceae bacterium]|nr:Uma2 family endonuclease [Syntrophobacteraceae bacterium]